MKTITYSLQGFDPSATLTPEAFAQAFPVITSTQMLYLGDSANTLTFIDADKAYQGLSPQEAVNADQGNVHVAVETLQELEKLLAQISRLDLECSTNNTRLGLDTKTNLFKSVLINARFRTGNLDDCSDTLESNSNLRLDLLESGAIVLNSDSISNTTVSLYAGLDHWDEPDYQTVANNEIISDFIEGFAPNLRERVSDFMVNYIEGLFKDTIAKHSKDIAHNLKERIVCELQA